MWRLEVESPRGARERGFLHFITTGPASAQAPPAHGLSGEGLRGAVGRVDGETIAVLFAGPSGEGHVSLGASVEQLVIAGLVPGRRYAISVDASSCVLGLAKAGGARDATANRGGFLRLGPTSCGAK
jgi:hypothetical protein